jgi:hypothetical protein
MNLAWDKTTGRYCENATEPSIKCGEFLDHLKKPFASQEALCSTDLITDTVTTGSSWLIFVRMVLRTMAYLIQNMNTKIKKTAI